MAAIKPSGTAIRRPGAPGRGKYPSMGPSGLDIEVEQPIGELDDQAAQRFHPLLAPPAFRQLLDAECQLSDRHGG
jgi:hypothetical protein